MLIIIESSKLLSTDHRLHNNPKFYPVAFYKLFFSLINLICVVLANSAACNRVLLGYKNGDVDPFTLLGDHHNGLS